MKHKTLAFVLAALALTASAGQNEDYFKKWAPVAVSEMKRSGVPASITLAQGYLESGSGLSTLATTGNNHFGIKCHKNWKGGKMYHDDDAKGECFRVYSSAEASFADHSDFLRYQDRYKGLFELESTDYKGWAKGLKKAGYATDPGYADKLIKIIEENRLYEYDNSVPEAEIPQTPLVIEEHTIRRLPYNEVYGFSLSRPVYEKNGVAFVYALEGDSYSSLASSKGLYLSEILRFNDLKSEPALKPGTVVFLQMKRNQAAPGMDKYVVSEDGESLHEISQRFCIKAKALRRLNSLPANYTPAEGDILLLRKIRKK